MCSWSHHLHLPKIWAPLDVNWSTNHQVFQGRGLENFVSGHGQISSHHRLNRRLWDVASDQPVRRFLRVRVFCFTFGCTGALDSTCIGSTDDSEKKLPEQNSVFPARGLLKTRWFADQIESKGAQNLGRWWWWLQEHIPKRSPRNSSRIERNRRKSEQKRGFV